MSDFCMDCSLDTFGEDFRDMANLVTAEQVAHGYGAVVLCEGCGTILVDHNGKRLEDAHGHLFDKKTGRTHGS